MFEDIELINPSAANCHLTLLAERNNVNVSVHCVCIFSMCTCISSMSTYIANENSCANAYIAIEAGVGILGSCSKKKLL